MDLERFTFGCRGLRISCWIVGIAGLFPVSSTYVVRGVPAVSIHRPCASTKAQKPQSLSSEGDAVGFQRIGPMQRPDRVHFGSDFGLEAQTSSRDSGRIGGVGNLVNDPCGLSMPRPVSRCTAVYAVRACLFACRSRKSINTPLPITIPPPKSVILSGHSSNINQPKRSAQTSAVYGNGATKLISPILNRPGFTGDL